MNKITDNQAPGQAEPLHPLIQDEVSRLEKKIAWVKSVGPQLAIAEELEKRFPGQFYTRSIDCFCVEVNIFFKFKTMAEATALLRMLATEKNLHLKGKPNIADSGDAYYWRLGGFCIIGQFSSSEADACKLVQVGTKTVPVYELRCGDKAAEVPELPAPSPAAMVTEGAPL